MREREVVKDGKNDSGCEGMIRKNMGGVPPSSSHVVMVDDVPNPPACVVGREGGSCLSEAA